MSLGLFIIAFILLSTYFGECRLDNHFRYYEIVKQSDFKRITKRSLDKNFHPEELHVQFRNEKFGIELQQDNSLLSPDFRAYAVDGEDNAKDITDVKWKLFRGFVDKLHGRSKVSALFGDDGSLENLVVRMPDRIFAAEPVSYYLNDSRTSKDLVFYSASDVISPDNHRKLQWSCGTKDTFDKDTSNFKVPRSKRSTGHVCDNVKHKACSLYLVADHSFFLKIGRGDYASTQKHMIQVVDEVNEIFKETTFGECGRGFGFRIEKIHIYENYSENKSHFNSNDHLNRNYEDFLRSFGKWAANEKLCRHCLAHLFTARPMLNNVLGLAKANGLCSGDGDREKVAFTTYTSTDNMRVPDLTATLVTAHELGHNFGSVHDFDHETSCTPPSFPGQFLMYPRSVSGMEPNNRLFSSCSIDNIAAHLKDVATKCLVAHNDSWCGNYKKEAGEECDDGFSGSPCCSKECRLEKDAKCSEGEECCNNCTFADNKTECQWDKMCHKDSFCTGNSAECGRSLPVDDREECRTTSNFKGICSNGACMDICQFNNKSTCLCLGKNECKVCCKEKSPVNSTCEPYHEVPKHLANGTSCSSGVCKEGICKDAGLGMMEWPSPIPQNMSQLIVFIKNNIVGIVMVVSIIIWVPASCTVAYIDRQKNREELEQLQWMSRSQQRFTTDNSGISIRNATKRQNR